MIKYIICIIIVYLLTNYMFWLDNKIIPKSKYTLSFGYILDEQHYLIGIRKPEWQINKERWC